MSKRKRPLAEYEWDLLHDNSYASSRRSRDEEDEEEETMHIDEEPQQTQQQQGMAVLNSMPIAKGTGVGRGKAATAVEDDVPCVCLDDHYSNNYNSWVNSRFPQNESDQEEEDEEEEASMDEQRITKRRKVRGPYDTREREECFLCMWGNRFHDGIKAKHVNILHGIMDNYGACDNIELAKQLHLYFKEKVYRPDKGMCMLTTEIALEHIVGMHSLSAVIFIGESIRAWKQAWFCFKNAIFKANGRYEKEAFNNFKECQKMLCLLYKMDPKNINFSYGKSREDINKLGMPFFMMPELKQVRDKDKRSNKTQRLLQTDVEYQRGIEL